MGSESAWIACVVGFGIYYATGYGWSTWQWWAIFVPGFIVGLSLLQIDWKTPAWWLRFRDRVQPFIDRLRPK